MSIRYTDLTIKLQRTGDGEYAVLVCGKFAGWVRRFRSEDERVSWVPVFPDTGAGASLGRYPWKLRRQAIRDLVTRFEDVTCTVPPWIAAPRPTVPDQPVHDPRGNARRDGARPQPTTYACESCGSDITDDAASADGLCRECRGDDHQDERPVAVGDWVRSFDFESRDMTGPRACYSEGRVVAIVHWLDCDRYEIEVSRCVFGGVDTPHAEHAFPPVNGTVATFGGVTDGVVRIPAPAGHRIELDEDDDPEPPAPRPVCPGCSGVGDEATRVPGLFVCNRCGGIIGRATRADAEMIVKLGTLVGSTPGDETRYFDIDLIGGRRVHGWFNAETGEVVQWG